MPIASTGPLRIISQPVPERPVSQRLRASGGCRDPRSLQFATIIYDSTVQFCNHFLDKRSPLVDQMTQAARSGRQNIEEGFCASAASSQTALGLFRAARASLEELLLAYEGFLGHRKIRRWEKDDPEAFTIRSLGAGDQPAPLKFSDYSPWLTTTSPGAVANCMICLIHQVNDLLDEQIGLLKKGFFHGKSETEQRTPSEKSATRFSEPQSVGIPGAPSCPKCGKPMALRTARSGRRPGSQFWGCVSYPKCNGLRNVDPV